MNLFVYCSFLSLFSPFYPVFFFHSTFNNLPYYFYPTQVVFNRKKPFEIKHINRLKFTFPFNTQQTIFKCKDIFFFSEFFFFTILPFQTINIQNIELKDNFYKIIPFRHYYFIYFYKNLLILSKENRLTLFIDIIFFFTKYSNIFNIIFK